MSRYGMPTAPMSRILLPLCSGILTGIYTGMPVWAAAVLCMLFCGAGVMLQGRSMSAGASVWLAIMFFGCAITGAQAYTPALPHEPLRVELQILGPVSATSSARTVRAEARCGAWSRVPGQWHRCRENTVLYIDSSRHVRAGEQIICSAYVKPLADSTSSYTRHMRGRGFFSRTYIPAASRIVRSRSSENPAGGFVSTLQSRAAERLRRLDMSGDCRETCVAMTAGMRSGLSPGIRKAYSGTGAAHLLAVSGLHVGIVFIIVNALLYLLPLLRYGHIIKNIAATAAVWGFVAMSGAAPSAVRAAIMFSALQLCSATGSVYNSFNAICSAAVLMLASRPALLLDTGFQMSFTAVTAIIFWAAPAMRPIHCRWKTVNIINSMIVIGIIASAALAPLTAYRFGRIPLAGFILNPAIILTAHIIILVSLFWIAAPIPAAAGLVAGILSRAAGFQNRIIEALAATDFSSAEVHIPLPAVLAIYAAMAAATAIYYHVANNKNTPQTFAS